MAISFEKHCKIWINYKGIIPSKIVSRLLAQRRLRPIDRLTLIINKEIVDKSPLAIEKLKKNGIVILNLEDLLEEEKCHCNTSKKLVLMAEKLLQLSKQHVKYRQKSITFAVRATNFLRAFQQLQCRGIYSDTDVIFKKGDVKLNKPILTGLQENLTPDIHIFAADIAQLKTIHAIINHNIEYFFDDIDEIDSDPGTNSLFYRYSNNLFDDEQFMDEEQEQKLLLLNELEHYVNSDVQSLAIQSKDASHIGNENHKILYAKDSTDPILAKVKQLDQIKPRNNKASQNSFFKQHCPTTSIVGVTQEKTEHKSAL
jgi:hypothetical protein